MMVRKNSGVFRKVLFLEIAGFLSLALSMGVIFMIVAIHGISPGIMAIPMAGLLVTIIFVISTIRYMRRDLHRIHELHSKKIYSMGKWLLYLCGFALIITAVWFYLKSENIWIDIESVVVADISAVTGIFAIYYTATLGYLIRHEHLRHSGMGLYDLLMVVLFPVGLVTASIWMMLAQKAQTVSSGKPDFELNPSEIIGEFERNEAAAAEKYVGKSVKFSGRVIEIAGDSSVLLKIASGIEDYTVNCGFDKSVYTTVKSVKQEDSIELQCSCSGVTQPDGEMDLLSEKSLEMVRCNLIQINGKH